MKNWQVALAFFQLIPALGMAQSDPVPMAVEEHFSLAAGNTEVGKNASGGEFAVYTDAGGRRKMRVTSPDGRITFEDEGQLTIENGAYCSQWRKLNQGRKVCGIKVFRDGDGFRSLRPDGSGSLHRFEPGNSRGL
jgi:hypothetical protein